MDKHNVVIIAPHFDDEIVGAFEVITNPLIKPSIVYMQQDEKRQIEALRLKNHIPNLKIQLFQKSIPQVFLNKDNVLYFPDPIFEFHPSHRQWGSVGESFARQGLNVVFYSINMQAPYVHEVDEPDKKRELLDKTYQSQKSLWRNDHKYFLFEGRCRWIF